MTAPRIPDTAIRAAARELCQFQAHDHYVVNGETCGPSEDAAEAVLAAALPLLGEIEPVAGEWISIPADKATTRTEWASGAPGYQVPSVSEAGARAAANAHGTQLWKRTVVTGEWRKP